MNGIRKTYMLGLGYEWREIDRENLLGTVRKGFETQNEQALVLGYRSVPSVTSLFLTLID